MTDQPLAAAIWQEFLGYVACSMLTATFDAYLKGSRVIEANDDACIDWHCGGAWHPWQPGGASSGPTAHRHPARDNGSGAATSSAAGQPRGVSRLVYRLSVVTRLPLLTPRQVAALADECRVAHDRYLAKRSLNVHDWQQISTPTLAGHPSLDDQHPPASRGADLPDAERTRQLASGSGW